MKRWLLLSLILLTSAVNAHWSNPGYLELKQLGPESFSVSWKVPLQQGRPIPLSPALPDACVEQTPVRSVKTSTASIDRWIARCQGGLAGKSIAIDGMQATVNDVLVRINRLDDTVQTVRLKGEDASFVVTASPSWLDVALTYTVLGVEHILSGIDHLLFVLALLMIVRGWRRLIATITAFTIAHSITLGAAVLGFVYVPRPPVEAVIALSIVFLAVEIARHHRTTADTRPGPESTAPLNLAYNWPWVVAFSFGLLHGFGFAGALTDVGLPQNSIPLALLFFNIGVELGQLLFVAGFLLLTGLLRVAGGGLPRPLETLTAYAIGTVAAYWTIERVASFWA